MLLAETVAARVPSVDMLRMTSSGTEAAMSAIRLARAATGREKLLKFAGAYHGHVDGLLAEAGSGLATAALPASPGVPAAATANTIIVPWNDPDAVAGGAGRARVRRDPGRALPGQHGPRPARSRASSSCCATGATANGALLVFDEVISGFRVAPGGAQELTGVLPGPHGDGQGHRRRPARRGLRRVASTLMERIAPAGDVYQAGHAVREPARDGRGAGGARAARRRRVRAACARPPRRWPRACARPPARRPVQVCHTTGLLTVFFCETPVTDYASAQACDLDAHAALVPRAARARRLPAAVAVRGVVPVARPHVRARRAHARGRGGGVP